MQVCLQNSLFSYGFSLKALVFFTNCFVYPAGGWIDLAAPLVISAAVAGPAAFGFSLFPLPAAFSPPLAAPDLASDSV